MAGSTPRSARLSLSKIREPHRIQNACAVCPKSVHSLIDPTTTFRVAELAGEHYQLRRNRKKSLTWRLDD